MSDLCIPCSDKMQSCLFFAGIERRADGLSIIRSKRMYKDIDNIISFLEDKQKQSKQHKKGLMEKLNEKLNMLTNKIEKFNTSGAR